jgi:glycosyltransferase involved in cell wall biosynthesis
VFVSCSAALGAGGLGRHFKEIADALERRRRAECEQQVVDPLAGGSRTAICISGADREREAGARSRGPAIAAAVPATARRLSRLPLRLARGRSVRTFFAEFDAYAAQRLPAADHLIAFNGQALMQLRVARQAGYESIAMVSANSHLRRVARQHARAHRQYPLEASWATQLVERNLTEYALADRIYVASQYTRESFLAEGIGAEMLALFPFTPDPRYRPDGPPTSETFEIVYTGSLSVAKGVPLLVDAVRRLPHADIRLVLVGGWATRGMRRFIQNACAGDRRISASPGDPLPHLRRARLYVHPSYEDGFAYAPAEALACGIPVIASEDTGMKELIEPGRDGLILPTGDLGALTEAIEAAYRGELLTVAARTPRSPRAA